MGDRVWITNICPSLVSTSRDRNRARSRSCPGSAAGWAARASAVPPCNPGSVGERRSPDVPPWLAGRPPPGRAGLRLHPLWPTACTDVSISACVVRGYAAPHAPTPAVPLRSTPSMPARRSAPSTALIYPSTALKLANNPRTYAFSRCSARWCVAERPTRRASEQWSPTLSRFAAPQGQEPRTHEPRQ